MNSLLVILLATSLFGATSEPLVQHDVANATSSPSKFDVVAAMKGALHEELHTSTHPKVIGVVALVFGICLWLHGGKSLDIFVTIGVSVVVGILAKQAVLQYWQSHNSALAYFHSEHGRHMGAQLVGIEAGLVTAAAVIKGHRGVMVAVGAAAGFWFASVASTFLVEHVSDKFDMAEVQIVWHSLLVFPTAYAVYANKHLCFLAYIAPFLGGAFISSAIMYFVTDALAAQCHTNMDCKPPHPQPGQWIDFFSMAFRNLVSKSDTADVGPFYHAGMDYHLGNSTGSSSSEGGVIFLDHVVLLAVWLVLWAIGCKVQLKIVKSTTKAREQQDLSEALLQRL